MQVGSVVTVVSQNHVVITGGDCLSNECSLDSTEAGVGVKDHGVVRNSACAGKDQIAGKPTASQPGCDGGAGRPASIQFILVHRMGPGVYNMCIIGPLRFLAGWHMNRLQRILPPKMPFFVRQKVQSSSKILPQIPNFASFSPSENEAL